MILVGVMVVNVVVGSNFRHEKNHECTSVRMTQFHSRNVFRTWIPRENTIRDELILEGNLYLDGGWKINLGVMGRWRQITANNIPVSLYCNSDQNIQLLIVFYRVTFQTSVEHLEQLLNRIKAKYCASDYYWVSFMILYVCWKIFLNIILIFHKPYTTKMFDFFRVVLLTLF